MSEAYDRRMKELGQKYADLQKDCQRPGHTPLPWQAVVIGNSFKGISQKGAEHDPAKCSVLHATTGENLICTEADARYLVHSANLYPQLVEALRSACVYLDCEEGSDKALLEINRIRAVLALCKGA